MHNIYTHTHTYTGVRAHPNSMGVECLLTMSCADRCRVPSGTPVHSGPPGNCACSEVNVYKQRLVDKQSCSEESADNMVSDVSVRLTELRDEITPQ